MLLNWLIGHRLSGNMAFTVSPQPLFAVLPRGWSDNIWIFEVSLGQQEKAETSKKEC